MCSVLATGLVVLVPDELVHSCGANPLVGTRFSQLASVPVPSPKVHVYFCTPSVMFDCVVLNVASSPERIGFAAVNWGRMFTPLMQGTPGYGANMAA